MTSKLSVDIVVSEMSATYSTSSTSVTCMLVATYIFGSDYTEKAPEIRTLGLVFNFPRRTAGLRAPFGDAFGAQRDSPWLLHFKSASDTPATYCTCTTLMPMDVPNYIMTLRCRLVFLQVSAQ